MKRNHPKADLYIAEREKGMTYQQIADKYGISRQAVAECCGKHSPGHFKGFSKESCIYPNLRRWLNENKVNRAEFLRRLGLVYGTNSSDRLTRYFRGIGYPPKQTIDKMLEVTGLTYEELWEVEG